MAIVGDCREIENNNRRPGNSAQLVSMFKTLNDGRLGFCTDERRSDLRQAMASRRTS